MLKIQKKLVITMIFSLTFFAQNILGQKFPSNISDYKNSVIYELNIRQYSQSGKIAEVTKDLPRLKKLGIDIIWLMPINPIGEINRKGSLGSYYSIKDYKAFNPEFGTLDDFITFVKEAHKQNFKVIIDWVANHTSWDNEWIKTNPDFYTKDSLGRIVSPVPDWHDVADLNYNNKKLWDAMIDAMAFWIKTADIDGFRCDVAGMVPTEFWIKAVKELNKTKPVFMLAEWETAEIHRAFNMTYSWDLYHKFNEIAKQQASFFTLDSLIKRQLKEYPNYAFRMNFITNHDENSWNGTEYERLGTIDAVKAFSVLYYTLPGMPLLYNGQEAALNKRLNFFEKDPIDWNNYPLADFYSSLNELKHNNPALYNGKFKGSYNSYLLNPSVATFERKNKNNSLFVIVNLSSKEQNITLPFDLKGTDLLNKNEIIYFKNQPINLLPFEYQVIKK